MPRGTVVGLIGENGAGKSTLIGAALGPGEKGCGHGERAGEGDAGRGTLGQVGVVFDGNNFPDVLSPAKLGRVLKRIYPSWDEPRYAALLERLGVAAGPEAERDVQGYAHEAVHRHGAFARVKASGAVTNPPAGWTRW